MEGVARCGTASLVEGAVTLVTVEARFTSREQSSARIQVTGLPDGSLREVRTRLPLALAAAGIRIPQGELHLHLSPSTHPKRGGLPELGIFLAAASALGRCSRGLLEGVVAVGELDLEARVRPTPGVLSAALATRRAGGVRFLAPAEARRLVERVPGLATSYPTTAAEALYALRSPGEQPASPHPRRESDHLLTAAHALAEVRGQEVAKRALVASAAGHHPLLMRGCPGVGKSMLARRLPALLSALSAEEELELLALADADPRRMSPASSERPFRAPHHTTSHAGLVGGGRDAHPGEVSLAHHGVLFLDELPEFRRDALEALREPLETGAIPIARAQCHEEHPASFLLVAAMNPCPCGWHGHTRRACRCSPTLRQRYAHRLSGPLLDRFDLLIELEATPPLAESDTTESPKNAGPHTRRVREGLLAAQEQRTHRRQAQPNGRLDLAALEQHAPLSREARGLLRRAVEQAALSARATQAIWRVARTLADLEDQPEVAPQHVAEALALHGRVRRSP